MPALNGAVRRQTNTLQHVYTETAEVLDQHEERWITSAVGLPQLRHLRHSTSPLQRSVLLHCLIPSSHYEGLLLKIRK